VTLGPRPWLRPIRADQLQPL